MIFMRFLKFYLISFVAMAIIIPACPSFETNEVETHLSEFSKYNVAQHDNIDDTSEPHPHLHKHSEDGEEHEHDHEHTKVVQSISKLIYTSSVSGIDFPEIKTLMGFTKNNLLSDPHAFGIFRPPII
jgi:hypothetical protein